MAQTAERRRSGPADGSRSGNGVDAAPDIEASRATRWLGVATALLLPIVALGLLLVALFGFLYWQDQAFYVSTDNAQITGALVNAVSPSAGQLRDVTVEVGDHVARGQMIAAVIFPGVSGSPQTLIRAPIDGVVVARQGNPGDSVAAGRPIVTLVDDSNIWVQAQIEETKVVRLRPGQPVEISVDSLGRTFQGHVATVGGATAASFAPQGPTTSSNVFVKVTQLVPVRIEVDTEGESLVVGGSAYVRIRT
jgi:multidrug resistance efflux pump